MPFGLRTRRARLRPVFPESMVIPERETVAFGEAWTLATASTQNSRAHFASLSAEWPP